MGAAPHGPVPAKREYVVGLVLAIVTLGFYGLWWHWVVHRELSDYLQQPVRGKEIWITYVALEILTVGLLIAMMVMTVVMVIMGLAENMLGMFTAMGGTFVLLGALIVAGLTALVLFVLYVVRQYEALDVAKGRLGVHTQRSIVRFMGFYFGGIVFSAVVPYIGFLGYFLLPVAYWFLHQEYDQVWDTVHQRRYKGTVAPAGSPGPVSA